MTAGRRLARGDLGEMLLMGLRSTFAMAFVVAGLCAAAAQTPRTLALRLLTPPHTEPAARVLLDAGLARVASRLSRPGARFKIEWRRSTANSAAEIFASLQAASADIALFDVTAVGDKLAILRFHASAPFHGLDAAAMARVLRSTFDRTPELRQAFLNANQVLLAMGSIDDQLLIARSPVASLADLRSASIGVSEASAQWLPKEGSKPVFGEASEHLAAIKAGKLDAAFLRAAALAQASPAPAGLHAIEPGIGASLRFAIAANKQRWDALPDQLRAILASAFLEFEAEFAAGLTQAAAVVRKDIAAKGVRIVDLPLPQRQAWAMALPNIARNWAAEAGKSGHPGNQIMDVYLTQLRANGAAPARDWRE